MYTKRISENTDEYDFLRRRAAALLDDGFDEQALNMLSVINQAQVFLIKPLLEDEIHAVP